MTQERLETMHRKRNKYEIIFSFGFDLGRLGQNQLWKKRFISNFWGAGQNPTVFYCDHSKESLLKVLLAYFSGFLCFYPKILDFPQFSSLPILPRVEVSKRQAMDIQHSLLTFLWLVVRSNISIECFHSRAQHLCKCFGTKESVCIRKEFNSQRIGLGHQHGRRFIVLGHQNGRGDVMWKDSILLILDWPTTATATKMSLKNRIHAASKFIALIPSRLIRQMLANFFGVEL